MTENNSDKTTTYAASEINKLKNNDNNKNTTTSTYNSKEDITCAYSDLQNNDFKSKTHDIGKNDKIILRENEFLITEIISEGTGEAVIYKVENSNKQTFALKLYFEFGNTKEEPNFETLKRLKDITDPDILKLHDFGVGADKYQGKFCYEISDYAEGGDLFAVNNFKEKYTKDFIEKSIVPEILNGIRKLHEFKIYHCDLKPSNIFFKDKIQTDLLIGDYGSAKAYDLETIKEIRKTSTVKGTETYLAPEQPRGIISEKNDYYSFGIILLHLLYPEQFSNDNNIKQVDKRKFEKIVERQYNSQQIVDFNPSYKRLNNLIEGLTLINHINRFGKIEVERWLRGEEVEVKYKVSETNNVQPVKLGYATIKTEKDFIEILETKNTWWEDLFEDEDTYFALKAWIGSYQNILSRKIFDEMIHYYKPLGKEFVKESAIRYFDPEREIRIDMNIFNFFTSNNIKKEVEEYISKLDDIWKITSINKLRFYIFQLEFSLQQLKKTTKGEYEILVRSIIDKIYSVFGLIQKDFNDFKTETQIKINHKDESGTFRLFINLFYSFNTERNFKDSTNRPIKTIDDLGFFYVQNEALFNDKYSKIEKERFLQKLNKNELIKHNYKEFIFEIFKDKAETQIELVNLTFNKHRVYTVKYKFYKSLKLFLSEHKISCDFTSRADENLLYENKRKFFQSFKSECEYFISSVTKKHNITTLTHKNLSQIRKKFQMDSWRRYFYIYSGQIFAFFILVPLAIIEYGIVTHHLLVDENWKFKWGKHYHQDRPINRPSTHNIYKAKKDTAIRSKASSKSKRFFTLKKGQEIEVLNIDDNRWYKVKINNMEGYIRSKDLTYFKRSDY
jgi:serine/threonine protein kinase